MTLTGAQELEFEEAGPRRMEPGRRIGVIVLGAILATVACGIIGVAFVQGSWWYSDGTDRALDRESRARVEEVRGTVDASGLAPEAVTSLNAALDRNADPTEVRTCLLTAQELLAASGDPELAQAAWELGEVIQAIRAAPASKWTATPPSAPKLEWP
jgi:hypothetical protein